LKRQLSRTVRPQIHFESEALSRFIFSREHYSRGRAKQNAFLPQKGKTAISMFFIDQLSPSEVWALGDFAGKNRGKLAVARAVMSRKSVINLPVKLELTPSEHPRHMNVCGWPTGKDEQKALALEFCAISTLSLRQSS
jgi:hypothetical protein